LLYAPNSKKDTAAVNDGKGTSFHDRYSLAFYFMCLELKKIE